jgi:hypothetical protein
MAMKSLLVLSVLGTVALASCQQESSSGASGASSVSSSSSSNVSASNASASSSSSQDAFVVTGWSYASVYQDYVNATKDDQITTEKKELYQFMTKDSFHVGNLNSLNMFPLIVAVNVASGDQKIITESDKVEVRLSSLSGTELALEDYLENVDALKTKGVVKFKSGVSGEYLLTFAYTAAASSMHNIVYHVEVVDGGYNVTTANELVAMNNQVGSEPSLYIEANEIKNWLNAKEIPEVAQNADKFILQGNFTINSENIPDCFMWDQADLTANGCTKTDLIGSLKDNVYIYEHALSEAHPEFALYGNFHRIALGTPGMGEGKFPYIMWDRKFVTGSQKTDGQPVGKLINSHSTLFGEDPDGKGYLLSTTAGDAVCQPYNSIIKDLYCTGNAGNDTTFDPTINAGPSWFKSPFNSSIDNCIVNTFFSGIDNSGLSGWNSSNGYYEFRCPTCDIANTRMYNSYSLMILGYRAGETNIKNCDIRNAGGPLLLATAPDIDMTKNAEHLNYRRVDINADANCGLENYSDGTTGWFAENGASVMVTQYKIYNKFLSYSPNNSTPGFNMSFLKDDSGSGDPSVGKIDFIGLVQPDASDAEGVAGIPGIGLPLGSVNVQTLGEGKIISNVVDQGAGMQTVSDAFYAAAAAPSDTSKTAAYVNSLNTTDFGVLYAAQAQGGEVPGMGVVMPPVFKAVSSDGDVNFIASDASTCAFMADRFTGGTGGWDAKALAQIQSAKMVTIYGFGRSEKNNWQTSFPAYKGAAPYGVVFGGFHTYLG